MTIEEYLASDFSGKPTTGDIGKESQWLDFCQLTVREGKVHVVDASYAADPVEGCMIELAPGSYQAQAKIMAYGRDTRISRLRVVRPGVAATVASQVGDTGTDTGNIGIYDYDLFARAWGSDNDASWEIISPAIESADTHGIAVLDESVGAVMPFVSSGFGDGSFPVHELQADDVRVGFEVIFIQPDERYPF